MNQVIIKDNLFLPEQAFKFIVSIIKMHKDNFYRFSYKDIVSLSMNYNYQKAKQFRQNLSKISQNGSLYILFCQHQANLYNKELFNHFSFQEIEKLYKNLDGIFGLTRFPFKSRTEYSEKNCLIILNKSLLKLDDWIGTLEHELTHFVQKVIGLEQTFKKSYHKKIDKKQTNNTKILRYATLLAKYADQDKDFIQKLTQKYTYMFSKNQIQETLKTLLLIFKNMYQRQITYNNGNIQNVNIIQDYSQKDKWLKQFLNLINSKQYLESEEFKKALDLWKKNFVLCNEEQIIKHRYISYIICYLGFKNILPQVNIDKKLKDYFQTIGK